MLDVCFNLNSQQISLTFAFSFSLLSILTENFDFFFLVHVGDDDDERKMMRHLDCAIHA